MRRRKSALREALFGYSLLLPAFALLGVFAYYPLYRLVRFSLYRPNRFGTGEVYVGPSNITDVLGGEEFRDGLWITVKYLIYTVPTGLVLGLLLALVAQRRLRGIKAFQAIFASTVATSDGSLLDSSRLMRWRISGMKAFSVGSMVASATRITATTCR